ncbi:aldo/keto reductase [Rhodococcus qingshengii]|nr:aldo/keto reductase [Rhodococcus qingshengii]
MTMARIPTVTLNNGAVMPALGFGLYKVDDDALPYVVETALAAGYRLFDTAPMYGNERGLGNALRTSGIDRSELFVTTKISNEDQGYSATLAAVEASLERLGMGYVDQVLIHWPVPNRGLYVETWQALTEVLGAGRARSIGVCNFDASQIDTLVEATSVVPAVNQIELHPLMQQHTLRREMNASGVRVQAWAPLARGQLVDNPVVVALARRHGVSPAQIVVRWHVQIGAVPIPKSSDPGRIRLNANVFEFNLDEADMAALTDLNADRRTGPHSDDVR